MAHWQNYQFRPPPEFKQYVEELLNEALPNTRILQIPRLMGSREYNEIGGFLMRQATEEHSLRLTEVFMVKFSYVGRSLIWMLTGDIDWVAPCSLTGPRIQHNTCYHAGAFWPNTHNYYSIREAVEELDTVGWGPLILERLSHILNWWVERNLAILPELTGNAFLTAYARALARALWLGLTRYKEFKCFENLTTYELEGEFLVPKLLDPLLTSMKTFIFTLCEPLWSRHLIDRALNFLTDTGEHQLSRQALQGEPYIRVGWLKLFSVLFHITSPCHRQLDLTLAEKCARKIATLLTLAEDERSGGRVVSSWSKHSLAAPCHAYHGRFLFWWFHRVPEIPKEIKSELAATTHGMLRQRMIYSYRDMHKCLMCSLLSPYPVFHPVIRHYGYDGNIRLQPIDPVKIELTDKDGTGASPAGRLLQEYWREIGLETGIFDFA